MSLISPKFDVKSIIFSQFWPRAFSQNCLKKPCNWRYNAYRQSPKMTIVIVLKLQEVTNAILLLHVLWTISVILLFEEVVNMVALSVCMDFVWH